MTDDPDEIEQAWKALDRSDWPEHRSADFGGVWPDGSPLMQAACPGCGLYRENDDSPDDHFDDDGPCPWMAAQSGSRGGSDV